MAKWVVFNRTQNRIETTGETVFPNQTDADAWIANYKLHRGGTAQNDVLVAVQAE